MVQKIGKPVGCLECHAWGVSEFEIVEQANKVLASESKASFATTRVTEDLPKG